jgi:hypothetical protein
LCDWRCGCGLGRTNFPRSAIAGVFMLRENNQTRHGRQTLVRRINRNLERDFISRPRFDARMTDNGVALRQREKIDGLVIRNLLAADFQS